MEKLHENPSVVNELVRILKEYYPYLEYSEPDSKTLSRDIWEEMPKDYLYVKVRPKMTHIDRDENVIKDICDKLSQSIKIPFIYDPCPPARFYRTGLESTHQNINTEWTAFTLCKAKFTTLIVR